MANSSYAVGYCTLQAVGTDLCMCIVHHDWMLHPTGVCVVDSSSGMSVTLECGILSFSELDPVSTMSSLVVTVGFVYSFTCLPGTTSVLLKLPMTIRVQRRYNNAAAVYRG